MRLLSKYVGSLPSPRKENAALFLYCLRTPMLLLMRPEVIANSSQSVTIRVPINWFTMNQYGTMFFGAIAAGADLTGGFAAFERAPALGVQVLYKNFSCVFLRRVDAPLYLTCNDVPAIIRGIEEAHKTGARVNVDVKVNGFNKEHSDVHPVVTAAMTLSLKEESKARPKTA